MLHPTWWQRIADRSPRGTRVIIVVIIFIVAAILFGNVRWVRAEKLSVFPQVLVTNPTRGMIPIGRLKCPVDELEFPCIFYIKPGELVGYYYELLAGDTGQSSIAIFRVQGDVETQIWP